MVTPNCGFLDIVLATNRRDWVWLYGISDKSQRMDVVGEECSNERMFCNNSLLFIEVHTSKYQSQKYIDNLNKMEYFGIGISQDIVSLLPSPLPTNVSDLSLI